MHAEGQGFARAAASAVGRRLTRPFCRPLSLAQSEDRFRSFKVRTLSTIVLIATFIGIIATGHVPLMLMILGIQVGFCLSKAVRVRSCDWSIEHL